MKRRRIVRGRIEVRRRVRPCSVVDRRLCWPTDAICRTYCGVGDDGWRWLQVRLNIGLVHDEAKRQHRTNRWIEYPELVSEGTLALYQAVKRYRPERAELSTYATKLIRFAILKYICRRAGECPDGELTDEYWSVPPSQGSELEAKELTCEVRSKVSELDEQEGKALKLRYGLDGGGGLSFRVIGNRLGFGRESARKLHGRAVERLREMEWSRQKEEREW